MVTYNEITKIDVKKKTATVTFSFDSDERQQAANELKELAILFGAYNKFGRSIGTAKYADLRKEFSSLLSKVSFSLDANERGLTPTIHKIS